MFNVFQEFDYQTMSAALTDYDEHVARCIYNCSKDQPASLEHLRRRRASIETCKAALAAAYLAGTPIAS